MRRLGILFGLVLGLLVPASANAASCVSNATGIWSNNANWLCNGVPGIPGSGDTATISGHTITASTSVSATSVSVTSGSLTMGSLGTVNAATVTLSGTGQLNQNVSTTSSINGIVTNNGGQASVTNGTVQMDQYVQTAGSLTLSGSGSVSMSNAPAQVSGGSVSISGGNYFFGGLVLTNGAVLSGTGNLAPGVTNTSGVIAPGGFGGYGIFTTGNGGFSQGPGGTLDVDVGAPGSGLYDRIDTDGESAALDGTLAVHRPAGSFANITIPVLTSGTRSGTFATITGLGSDLSAVYGTGLSLKGPDQKAGPPIIPLSDPVITLPANKKCVSKRTIKITQNPPSGTALSSATITLNGKAVKAKKTSSGGFTATINLKGLKKGKAKVKIIVTTAQGKTATSTRTYKTCTKKKKK